MRRIRFWAWLARLNAAHYLERLQLAIVWHLPRWVIYWATIRAYSQAWHDAGNKTPDELTYTEVADGARHA